MKGYPRPEPVERAKPLLIDRHFWIGLAVMLAILFGILGGATWLGSRTSALHSPAVLGESATTEKAAEKP